MSKHTAGIMSVLRKREEEDKKKQNRKTTRGEKKKLWLDKDFEDVELKL